MVGTVNERGLHADYGIGSQRPFHAAFLHAFFHCREIVPGHGAAKHVLLKYIR